MVKITSTHIIEGDEDELNLITFGTFKEKGNKKYIIYKEYNENIPEKFKICIIKIDNKNMVTLIKNDVSQTRLILETGKRHYSPYYTDVGSIMMGVFTNYVNFEKYEDKVILNLKYSLEFNSSIMSINEIKIEAVRNSEGDIEKNV
ncbi:MAG: DUF1934 domain-containing protein [Acutalibacteraceae bacterium]